MHFWRNHVFTFPTTIRTTITKPRIISDQLQRSNWTMYQMKIKLLLLIIIFTVLILIQFVHSCLAIPDDDPDDDLLTSNNQLSLSDNDEQWTFWSPWSPCSRICNGGVSTSVRRCVAKTQGCNGPHIRHKLCNMQPCLLKTDFRQMQCSLFNNKPYRDRYYEWLAYIDPTDPCSLTCKAKGLNFVAKLSPHITDGTRCRADALDVCVSGKCLTVGCDLQLGSLKRIDECGVCGGDGQSCKNHSYSWKHRFPTDCSKPCAGGTQTSTVVCMDDHHHHNQTIVDDVYCLADDKPQPLVKGCNEFDCKPNWITGEWSTCSRECGIGTQTRAVECQWERMGHQIQIKVDEKQCLLHSRKPETERKCNVDECPQWFEGQWSQCSETCGSGIQRRQVVCKDNRGFLSEDCDQLLKPTDQRNCSDISDCLHGKSLSQEDSPRVDSFFNMPVGPSYDIGPWSACNATCGLGYRQRQVKCQIYLEFSQTWTSIPMSQCTQARPSEMEPCYGSDCDLESNLTYNDNLIIEENEETVLDDKYEWSITGFTNCSAYCLGGTQDSIIECVRMTDNTIMLDEFCDENRKPEIQTRICNDQPCIPRWNASGFGECSKKCGSGGLQTRTVLCVHEIARGPNNFVVIPEQECPLPKPATEQKCNQIDCPAKWTVEPWQKCSRDCGGGLKKRNIRCIKDFVFGGLQNVSSLECSIRKPKTSKQCNLKPCREMNVYSNEMARKSKRNHFVGPYLDKPNQKYSFQVQGMVTVYEGSRLKLSCPEWNPGSSIDWFKGHDRLQNNRKMAMSKDVLKIRNVRVEDTGVYKCIYENNQSEHSMFLHVLSSSATNNKPPVTSNVLNDQTVVLEPTGGNDQLDHYYQNELDVSREMEKYSLKSKSDSLNVGKIHLQEKSYPNQPKGGIHEFITNFRKPSQDFYGSSEELGSNEIGVEANFSDGQTAPKTKTIGKQAQQKYNWITTDWSNCTLPCGGFGFRIRHSQCYSRMGNMTRMVEDSFCLDGGLKKPTTFETCGLESCSFWDVGPWSKCQDCVELNKGIRTRNVDCSWRNGTLVSDADADYLCYQWSDKPIDKQECYQPSCVPTWQTMDQCLDGDCPPKRCVWKYNSQPIDDSFCAEEIPTNGY